MKKSKILSVIFIIASIALISWSLIVLAGARASRTSDNPSFQYVTKNDCYYNISLAFKNVTYAERLDNILINPNSQENVIGLTSYLNGTAVNAPDPVSYNLQKGDSLQVNLV